MKRLVAATAVAAAALTAGGAAPANAFDCPVGTPINTGEDQIGIPGVLTVQVCSEGIRILPTGELTTVVQAGVKIDGQEVCVVVGRVIIDLSPLGVTWDMRGLFGTPVFLSCPV